MVVIYIIYWLFLFMCNWSILMRKNIFTCMFSVHNTISLSGHKQVCLWGYVSRDTSPIIGTWWEKYLSKCRLIKHTWSWRDNLLCDELYLFKLFKINCFLTIFLNNDHGQISHLVSLFRNYIRAYFLSTCYLKLNMINFLVTFF